MDKHMQGQRDGKTHDGSMYQCKGLFTSSW